MTHRQIIYGLIAAVSFLTTTRAQILNGDGSFPILDELRWEMNLDQTKEFFEERHILERSTDTSVIAGMKYFNSPARIEVAFYHGPAVVSSINVKFIKPTREIEDSVVHHLTSLAGSEPVRQTKQKSLIFITLKMEVATWKVGPGAVSLISAKHNDEIFDLFLSFLPPPKKRG